MVAIEKISRLLDILRDNLSDLKRYARSVPRGSLGTERDRQHMVLHAMYVTIQTTIDIGNHLLADRGLPRATSYAAIFERLAEGDVLEGDLAGRLAAWASMRNVLAHFYPVIDLDRVEAALQQDLGDFDDFIKVVDPLVPQP